MKKAIEIINKGGVLLHKTDTIWGLACDAKKIESIKKVYSIKKRDLNKPLIILVSDKKMLNEYVEDVPENILSLINEINGLATIIYPNPKSLPEILIHKGSIAIRITKHKKCQAIINETNKPIISTSANISGEPFPKRFSEINSEIKKSVDYILKEEDNNKETISNPSSLYKINEKQELEYINR